MWKDEVLIHQVIAQCNSITNLGCATIMEGMTTGQLSEVSYIGVHMDCAGVNRVTTLSYEGKEGFKDQ